MPDDEEDKRVIRPITQNKITIPKEYREKYEFDDYVEFFPTEKGVEVRPLEK